MNIKRMSKPDLMNNSSDDEFEDEQNNKPSKDANSADDEESENKLSYSYILEEIRKKIPPPYPLLPKSFFVEDEGAMSGGIGKMLLLNRFKGMDRRIDLLNWESGLAWLQSQYQFSTTLYKIFNPYDDNDELREDIVYYRDIGVDQTKALTIAEVNKNGNLFNTNKLDVKKLLKSNVSTSNKRSVDSCVQTNGLEPFYSLKDVNDKTLIFESRFESGNLYTVLKVNDNEYHMWLQNDVNTMGHTQWFFFRVQNTTKDLEVKFNIMNLSKPDSLFNHGMKPLIYSEKKVEEEDVGWFRDWYEISYFNNGIRKENGGKNYTLTFKYKFEHSDDTVFFAYWYPYTYSDLKSDLISIERNPKMKNFWTIRSLCRSLAGNSWDYLTITNKNKLEDNKKKKAVILTARVHPGETVGSWMMKGVLDFLTDPDNEDANTLRDNFVFKVIPMLNPDGVINGNYRCSLAGSDLNRRWKNPSKILHPTIYHAKKMIQEVHSEREVILFCDLHGHSRKKDIFMYGCNIPKKPEETRIFPYILGKICPFFYFNYSRFGVQKSKESTARVVLFKSLKIPSIFTWESSFWGNENGPFKDKHFTREDLKQVGKDIWRSILIYTGIKIPSDIELPFEKFQNGKVYKEDLEGLKEMFMDELRGQKELIEEGDGDSSCGSDEAPSDDNLEIEQIWQLIPAVDKKLKNALKSLSKKQAEAKNKKDINDKNSQSQKAAIEKEQNGVKRIIKVRTKISKKIEKVKPIMVDAWTQTERSDFAIIKYKMQKKIEQKAHLEMSSHLPGSSEKNKMALLLNSQTQPQGSKSALRSDSLGPHKSLTAKMVNAFKNSTTPHNRSKGSNLEEEQSKFGQIGKKSQLTLGFSKNTIKAPIKRSALKVGKKKKEKTRLPSIQGNRDNDDPNDQNELLRVKLLSSIPTTEMFEKRESNKAKRSTTKQRSMRIKKKS
jgi:hypothetical protein